MTGGGTGADASGADASGADASGMSGSTPAALVALALGALAFVLGTAMGWNADLLDRVVTPPVPVRAALVGGAVVFAGWALRRGFVRISDGRDPARGGPAALIRGVRFVFLAVAGLSAAAGWLLGHPLPLIVALVIAAVDVLETTFLLLVLGARRAGGHEGGRTGAPGSGPATAPSGGEDPPEG